MKLSSKTWDSSEYLKKPEDIAVYLSDMLSDPEACANPALMTHALGVVARAKGMTEIARETGLSRESLYKALSEDGNPSFATVMKVLQALSIELRAQAKTDATSGPEAA
jgi:probable addiction module antidote protein